MKGKRMINSSRKNNEKVWSGKEKLFYNYRFSDQLFMYLYQFLSSFPLSRNYIYKLSYRYRLICPCSSREIAKKTILACLISWCLCLFAFFIVFMANPGLSSLIAASAAIVIANCEIVSRMARYYEITTLQDLQKIICNVEHYYYVEYRVDDALYRCMDNLPEGMKPVVEQIYYLLLADDKEEALRSYYENTPNRYLREFVSQCMSVMERGDKQQEDKSLFIRNLEKLCREIDIETDKLQRLEMEFAGVIICVVAPIFCIDFVKQFAVDIKENMYSFYYGKEGFIFDTALIAAISFIYLIMRKSAEYMPIRISQHGWLHRLDKIPLIKKAMDNFCDRNASIMERLARELKNSGTNIKARHFVLRSFLIAFSTFFLGAAVIFYLHALGKKQLLTVNINEIESIKAVAKENQYQKISDFIAAGLKEYLAKPESFPESKEALETKLIQEGSFSNKAIIAGITDEIFNRFYQYQREYFSFMDLLICFVLSVFAYCLPYLLLRFNASVSREAMDDEVNHFNALICMLMHIDSITVKQILEELETIAQVFRESLRKCLNNYSSGDMQALQELKENEPYEPFARMVDNFIRSDDMPVYQAFHEIDTEREGYMARRKLANEKSIRRRMMRAYILAGIPFLLLFAYGVIPPLIASMTEINNMLEELQNSAW